MTHEEAELKKRVSDLSDEVGRWRALALWALDCHAATAEDLLMLKSTPSSRRHRLKSVCRAGAGAIEAAEQGGDVSAVTGSRAYYHNHDVGHRLRRAQVVTPESS